MRFTIRDLLWLTLFAALCLAGFRIGPPFLPGQSPLHLMCSAVAVTSGCAAIGGVTLHPGVGAVIGLILSCLYAPIWFLIQASAAC